MCWRVRVNLKMKIPKLTPISPFSESACRAIIEDIRKSDEIKPRSIMQAFDAVLQEADDQIESGQIRVISPKLAKEVLADLVQFE